MAMIAGIIAGRYAGLSVGFWLAAGAAAMLAAVCTFRREHLRLATVGAIGLAVASVGAALANTAYYGLPADHVVTFTGPSRQLSTLRGRIVSTPQVVDDSPAPEFGYRRPARTMFLVEASGVRTPEGFAPTRGMVRVTLREPELKRQLSAGRQVELVGWLARYRAPDNPGQYDRRAAARNDGLLVRMDVPAADGATVLSAEQPWYARIYWRLRSSVRQHLENCGEVEDGRLLEALIIGERHPSLENLNRIMMRAGVVHYMSISGSHLAIFLGFVYLLCRLLALTPRLSAWAVLTVLAAYMLLAEPNAPLLRSAIMAAALCLATILGRPHAAVNALGAAAIVILAMDPLELFSPGFQLSFGIVGGMIVLHQPVRLMLFGPVLRRRGLTVFRSQGRFRRWFLRRASDGLILLTVASVTAYAVSAPLVAWHFGLFSPYAAPLSALLAAPVAGVLVPGYLAVALQGPMPNLAGRFGELASGAAGLLSDCVGWMESLPGLSLEMRPVGLSWVLLCYAAIAVIVLHRRLPLGRWCMAATLIALTAATIYAQRPAAPPACVEMNLLDVGAGQCALVRTPGGKTFIIDAGTRGGFDAWEYVLRPFLRQQRLAAPSAMFISHSNTDHFNAAAGLVRRGGPRLAYMNECFSPDASDPVRSAEKFLELLARRDVPVVRLTAGQTVRIDQRTSVQVLWPPQPPPAGADVNETSLVLRLTCDGRSMLLPADIGPIAQAILAEEPSIRSDVLLMPHHGGWTASLERFVQAVAPKVVLVSSWQDPVGPATPPQARGFFSRLKTAYRYYSTARNGWCQVRLGRGDVEVTTTR